MRIRGFGRQWNVLYRNGALPTLGRMYSRILGIETSCDDTGCAVVDTDRNILGECLMSQQQIHLEFVINYSLFK